MSFHDNSVSGSDPLRGNTFRRFKTLGGALRPSTSEDQRLSQASDTFCKQKSGPSASKRCICWNVPLRTRSRLLKLRNAIWKMSFRLPSSDSSPRPHRRTTSLLHATMKLCRGGAAITVDCEGHRGRNSSTVPLSLAPAGQ